MPKALKPKDEPREEPRQVKEYEDQVDEEWTPSYPNLTKHEGPQWIDDRDAALLLEKKHILLLAKPPRRLIEAIGSLLTETKEDVQRARTRRKEDPDTYRKALSLFTRLVFQLELLTGERGRSDQVVQMRAARAAEQRYAADDAPEAPEEKGLFGSRA